MKSESGFGLLEAMIVLVIASIAITGLFLASIYARAQAVENYHYRSALLHAAGQLELIRFSNQQTDGNIDININGLKDEVVIDDDRQIPLKALISYEVKRSISDRAISLKTVYDRVKVTVTWKEKDGLVGVVYNNDNVTKSLVLVDDYFYQKVITGVE